MESSQSKSQEGTSWLARFGCTVCVATLASLLASSPAALRLAGAADLDIARAWLTTAGLLVAPMLVLLPLARLARESLRSFSGEESHAIERASAAIFFVSTWLWGVQTIGALLRSKTHQRALGGVTFALIALGSCIFLALVARRLAKILATLRAKNRNVGLIASVAVAFLGVALFGMRVSQAASAIDLGTRAVLVDGVAAALSLAFFARKMFDDRRVLSRIGPPLAVLAIVVSMHTLVTSSSVAMALEKSCPLHFALLKGFAGLAI